MGSARTQPTRFRIPKMSQTFTANTLDLKKSKVQNKSSDQSPRPCHHGLGLEERLLLGGNKAQRSKCGQPALASAYGVSGPRPETGQDRFHGPGVLPGRLVLFSSPNGALLLGYMGKTLLIQVSTHWLLPHATRQLGLPG